jgi:hypothetical protein
MCEIGSALDLGGSAKFTPARKALAQNSKTFSEHSQR